MISLTDWTSLAQPALVPRLVCKFTRTRESAGDTLEHRATDHCSRITASSDPMGIQFVYK
jgi:hypothetical protein